MNIDILEQKKVPLMERTEITAKLTYQGVTPKASDIAGSLATKAKVKPELLALRKISPDYGKSSATVTAFAYDNEKAKKDYAPKLGKKAKEKMKKEAEAKKGEQ